MGEALSKGSPLYWIIGPWAGRLAISARPRGGDWLEDEVKGWSTAGVNVVASLLTPEEEESLSLKEEMNACLKNGIEFRSFPILDRGVPRSYGEALRFIQGLQKDLVQGKTVALHCRQSLGRSALIAGALLVLGGVDPEDAIRRLSAARTCPVPETVEQSEWIGSLARESERAHAHQ